MIYHFLLFFLGLISSVQATELAPWFGRSAEIEFRSSALFQFFQNIATPVHPNRYGSFDQFCTLSASTAFDTMSVESEIVFANTRHRSFGFDCLKLTSRASLMNDVIGDKFSLTAGTTFNFASLKALHDLASFHHGTLEFETHFSIGKEYSYLEFWTHRYFAFFAYCMANKGYPWLKAELAFEKNFKDIQQLKIALHSLFGLGNKNIAIFKRFPGYGPFKHRNIDLSFRYTFLINCLGGSFSLEYTRRLYALNFPNKTNLVMLRLYFPFGL